MPSGNNLTSSLNKHNYFTIDHNLSLEGAHGADRVCSL